MRGLILLITLVIGLGSALVEAQAQTRSLTQTDADSAVGLPEPTLEARIIESLRNSGYVRIQRSGTLLGRVRITGLQAGTLREIVLNPHTREILRDVEFQADGSAGLGHGTRDGGRLNAN
ncbi:MAG: hypothetical protein AAGG09_18835 [Pseudomonadota bacterium]